MSWMNPAITIGFKNHSISFGLPGSLRVPQDVTHTILCKLLLKDTILDQVRVASEQRKPSGTLRVVSYQSKE